MTATPNKSLDRSADSLFLNLFGPAKVGCKRRARSTPPLGIFFRLSMDYHPTTIQSGERPWSDALAVFILLLAILFFPITWPLSKLWRHYRLYSRGFYVTGKGRDLIEYQERRDGTICRLTLYRELMAPPPNLVYVPTEDEWQRDMPAWARERRQEIIENVKRALGTKRYEFVFS